MDAASTSQTDDLLATRYSLLSRLENWQDHESWKIFFDCYWRLIYSVALKSGLTQQEAEEVVQETIICVAKDIQKFKRDRDRGSFKGWLCNLTRWRIADQLRKRTGLLQPSDALSARKYQPIESIPDVPDSLCSVDWEQEWQDHVLGVALERLKKRVREEHFQIFHLILLKQWSVQRISQTFGISAARVYLIKHRLTRLLRKEISSMETEWSEK